MATITAKVISATSDAQGVATIVLEFDDGTGKWQKTYKQAQDTIVVQDFKDMVAADIRKDLNVKTQLTNINPIVGKTFTFTV